MRYRAFGLHHVSALKRHTQSFASLYFSKEDLEHLAKRHGSEHDK